MQEEWQQVLDSRIFSKQRGNTTDLIGKRCPNVL
jgi:hypothetical protein